MNDSILLGARLANQRLTGTPFHRPEDLVRYMGVMQAQDFPMARWAVGVRLEGAHEKDILSALSNGDILRTHMLRPTWHFVAIDDIRWMTDISRPQIQAALKFRHKFLKLTPAIMNKVYRILERELRDGPKSRAHLVKMLAAAKLPMHDNRPAHYFLCAEIEKLVCSGPLEGTRLTYALFDERVPPAKKITREEGLSRLALRYFTSHGPATLKDFVWWSGLSVADAKRALEGVKSQLVKDTVGREEYWLSHSTPLHPAEPGRLYLLPSYDEFLIGYADRTAALLPTHHKTLISANGIFYPIVVVGGVVTGQWKRTIDKDGWVLTATLLRKRPPTPKRMLAQVAEAVGHFYGVRIKTRLKS